MRKWYVPLAVLSVGGLGVLLFSDRGRRGMRWLAENFDSALDTAPDTFLEWNEAAQRELDRVQSALNRVAESLEAVR